MVVKIIQTYDTPVYHDIGDIPIDLSRKSAVLYRQSMRKGDKNHPESRLMQEHLLPTAIRLRREPDESNVLVYDEGAGVSGTKGYDEREKLSALYLAIANDVVGSIFVARPDRLFRDKHFVNVSMFTKLAEAKRLILVVPGRRYYDFTIYDHLKEFQKEMQDAYGYIATHIKYMHDTRALKKQRGYYSGGGLPAPYVIDRYAWKEQQKPMIYQPWLEPAIDLFEKFQMFDFSIAHICRYIESKPYIFLMPPEEDMQRFMFLSNMHLFQGGYSFSDMRAVKDWLSNLTHGGYAKVGRDEEGNILYMPNAFDAAIPFALLDEVYAAITGHHIDGMPFEGHVNRRRYMRVNPQGSQVLFHGLITSNQGHVAPHRAGRGTAYDYHCFKEIEIAGYTRKRKFMTQSTVQWTLRAPQFDRIVIDRLFALSKHDTRMTDRVKKTFDSMKGTGINEKDVLQEQIQQTQAQIDRYDFLLTDIKSSLDKETAIQYATSLAELRPKLARLLEKQKKRPDVDPEQTISNFYFVLAHLTTEFYQQGVDVQKQMMTKLVQQITVDKLSPHLFSLYIIWQDGVARRPDIALLWRAVAVRDMEGWSEEEEMQIRRYWPNSHPLDILRSLPERSMVSIAKRAMELGVRRTLSMGRQKGNLYHRTMTYADLQAATQRVNKEDEAYICSILNDMAETSKRGEIAVYWPLPVERVGFSTIMSDNGGESKN